ncbi:NEP1-interacting protein 2 isoform X3 [Manihot esculenta]|uniref:NEP1-interacting protein 2 isoform X3 n=1 Tax=Manihot esculenta TaxID=3983 RepID=UPI000B5D5FC5|nr:NEP1-interacting protein 2 isoform X3 [Manihot esculenta]
MADRWFTGMVKALLRCQEAVSLWVLAAMEGFVTGIFIGVMKKVIFAAFTCIFALGGAAVGTVIGAMKGQTTETGFFRGSGIGAVSGAITAFQLLESAADGEPLSKPDEWEGVHGMGKSCSAKSLSMAKIYDTSGNGGLSKNCIQKLPQLEFQSNHQFCCSICLQDLKDGDWIRELPNCGHLFHMDCIDKWLCRNGSCPMCRIFACNDSCILHM